MVVKKNIKISLLNSFFGLLSFTLFYLYLNLETIKELNEEFFNLFFFFFTSTFIVTFILLKLLKNKFFISLFSGILNHFLFFISSFIFDYLKHFFHNDLDNLCSCQQDISSLLYKSFFISCLSIYYIGWLTVIISFISVYFGDKIFKDFDNEINI